MSSCSHVRSLRILPLLLVVSVIKEDACAANNAFVNLFGFFLAPFIVRIPWTKMDCCCSRSFFLLLFDKCCSESKLTKKRFIRKEKGQMALAATAEEEMKIFMLTGSQCHRIRKMYEKYKMSDWTEWRKKIHEGERKINRRIRGWK